MRYFVNRAPRLVWSLSVRLISSFTAPRLLLTAGWPLKSVFSLKSRGCDEVRYCRNAAGTSGPVSVRENGVFTATTQTCSHSSLFSASRSTVNSSRGGSRDTILPNTQTPTFLFLLRAKDELPLRFLPFPSLQK